MILIGLYGRAGSGKDTAFSYINEWAVDHYMHAIRRGFADMLKLSAYRLFNPDGTMREALAWSDEMKTNGSLLVRCEGEPPCAIDGRTFFQRYGTESHRDIFGYDFWVDRLLPLGYATPVIPKWWDSFIEIIDYNSSVAADIAVITDVRFENEALRIKQHGGEIWEIVRPVAASGDSHPSESGLSADLVDHTINNDGTLDDFAEQIKALIERKAGN